MNNTNTITTQFEALDLQSFKNNNLEHASVAKIKKNKFLTLRLIQSALHSMLCVIGIGFFRKWQFKLSTEESKINATRLILALFFLSNVIIAQINFSVEHILGEVGGTGVKPPKVNLGDFNNDGNTDIVLFNNTIGKVSVLTSTGFGTFENAGEYSFNQVYGLEVSDITKDGNLDIIVGYGASISVITGTGTGSFNKAFENSLWPPYQKLIVNDFNADGNQDILLSGNGNILLTGTGTGSFRNYGSIVGGCFQGMQIDINGDNTLDLICNNTNGFSISVQTGTGIGNYGIPKNHLVGNSPSSFAIGDLNKDGYFDLAVTNRLSDNVSILMGIGNGSFEDAINYNVGKSPISIVIEDFNNDGYQDLAVANETSTNIQIILNTIGGVFTLVENYLLDSQPYNLLSGDFNGDGNFDLAVSLSKSSNLTVLTGTGNGSFGKIDNNNLGSELYSVAVGDFNKDLNLDLVIANRNSNNISVLLGKGTGKFNSAVNYNVGNGPRCVVTGDFNNDGSLDLAVSNFSDNNVSIFTGSGTGSFNNSGLISAGLGPINLVIDDFNNDGNSDMAISNHLNGLILIITGTGTGNFENATYISASQYTFGIATGDFNNDNQKDIVITNSNSDQINVFTGSGTGSFAAAGQYNSLNPFTQSVAVSDFNDDEENDIVVGHMGIVIFTGSGLGGFTSINKYNGSNQSRSLVVGDFNDDGKNDIATANFFGHDISIFTGDGNGKFNPVTNFTVGSRPSGISMGDFNNDGKIDLVTTNSQDRVNCVSILLNNTLTQPNIVGLKFKSVKYGANFLYPKFSKGNEVKYICSNSNILNMIENRATATGLGVVTITAFQDGNATFSGITLTGIITVTQANLTIKGNDFLKVYGEANPVFTGSITGIVNSDNISAVYSSVATQTSNVGVYPITASATGANINNYQISIINSQLSISVANATITAFNATKVYGETNPVFTGSITGIVNGDNISALFSSVATQTSNVGVYPITATATGANINNYQFSIINSQLSISAANATITAFNATKVYGEANPVFAGSIAGIVNGDNISALYSSVAIQTSNVGVYPITATATGANINNYQFSIINSQLSITTAPSSASVSGIVSAGNVANATSPTSITISGTGFVQGATVTINGVVLTNVTVVNGNTIIATLPAGATTSNNVNISVQNPNQTPSTSSSVLVKDITLSTNLPAYQSTNFSIYPNPTYNGEFIVENSDWKTDNVLMIYNAQGAIVHAQKIVSSQTFIKTNLASGIYFVKQGRNSIKLRIE